MQNLFTKFFERKSSNEYGSHSSAKKKKKQNVTLDNINHITARQFIRAGSNSPSPRRIEGKISRGTSPNGLSKASPRLGNQIPTGLLSKNFLQPIQPNHLKMRPSPSQGFNSKPDFQKLYKILHQTPTVMRAVSPRERSADFQHHQGSGRKQINIVHSNNMKVARKSSNPRETSDKRMNLTSENSDTANDRPSKRKIEKPDVSKVLLEKSRLNREFLSLAKKNNAEQCIQLLTAENGKMHADVNCKDKDGWTALHHAAYNGNIKFLNLLLYNDAKVDPIDQNGVTPLILAVAKGSSVIAHVLLNAKADYQIKDSKGNTALHYGVVQQHKSCVDLILSISAEGIYQKNAEGLSPLDLCPEDLKKTLLSKFTSLQTEYSSSKTPSKKRDRGLQSTKVDSGKAISHLSDETEVV